MTNDFNMPVTPHRLELMDRAHLTVSGVEDVERFDESGVIMTTSADRHRGGPAHRQAVLRGGRVVCGWPHHLHLL